MYFVLSFLGSFHHLHHVHHYHLQKLPQLFLACFFVGGKYLHLPPFPNIGPKKTNASACFCAASSICPKPLQDPGAFRATGILRGPLFSMVPWKSSTPYGCFLKWWYPPKHPKMIIFSRKTQWLLGTTILGNHYIHRIWWVSFGGYIPF